MESYPNKPVTNWDFQWLWNEFIHPNHKIPHLYKTENYREAGHLLLWPCEWLEAVADALSITRREPCILYDVIEQFFVCHLLVDTLFPLVTIFSMI